VAGAAAMNSSGDSLDEPIPRRAYFIGFFLIFVTVIFALYVLADRKSPGVAVVGVYLLLAVTCLLCVAGIMGYLLFRWRSHGILQNAHCVQCSAVKGVSHVHSETSEARDGFDSRKELHVRVQEPAEDPPSLASTFVAARAPEPPAEPLPDSGGDPATLSATDLRRLLDARGKEREQRVALAAAGGVDVEVGGLQATLRAIAEPKQVVVLSPRFRPPAASGAWRKSRRPNGAPSAVQHHARVSEAVARRAFENP